MAHCINRVCIDILSTYFILGMFSLFCPLQGEEQEPTIEESEAAAEPVAESPADGNIEDDAAAAETNDYTSPVAEAGEAADGEQAAEEAPTADEEG